jgi:hypothetical protein
MKPRPLIKIRNQNLQMRFVLGRIWLAVLSLSVAMSSVIGQATADETADALFENHIRPILVESCFRCHGDAKTSGTLRVDSREALLAGGESGAAIVPGKPEESLLIRAIQRHEDVSAMPPEKDKALRPDQIAAFADWIRGGAHWPTSTRKFETHQHWAFEPIHNPAQPEVADTKWIRNSLDAFIRAPQERAGVQPAPMADKVTLIRRATFDLTGLPPAPADVDAFMADNSPQAFENVIERLLASKHYGERWARHWLDVVRYADTAGETADYPVPLAWRYRNYVIDAFHADKPYDQFLREQIAGDVIANRQPSEKYAEQVTATGYLAISRRFGFDSENYHHLTIQDTIDTLGQSVLGLSLGCARCHDHKFDAISMTDYYGLFGIFDSSRYAFPGSEQKKKYRAMVPLLPPSDAIPKWREFDQRVGVLATHLEQQKEAVPTAILRSLNDMDGDFEMQAPAAGGSNGVLVPPWLYEGKIAVTNAAQSPFKNLYARGKVGASLAADVGHYRIAQSIYPQRSSSNCDTLFVNLDFRLAASDPASPDGGQVTGHQFWIGAYPDSPVATILISTDGVSLLLGDATERIGDAIPNTWQNLQLSINLQNQTISGTVGTTDGLSSFSDKPISGEWKGTIDFAVLESTDFEGRRAGRRQPPGTSHIDDQKTSALSGAKSPAIEFDHLGIQDSPIAPASTELLTGSSEDEPDFAALSKELHELVGMGSDFEIQANNAPPASPWNAGPNSVVVVSKNSQSPFANNFATGEHGIHMPNRGEYDGFGQALPKAWVSPETETLFTCFDFRCTDEGAGSDGSWRYYVGSGPGNSAAIELFFNGREFFSRSGDVRESVCGLNPGEWYQLQTMLDLKSRLYTASITSNSSHHEFRGEFASGWNGRIDYSFIDSYGHIGGIRPALDVDNYGIREFAYALPNAATLTTDAVDFETRLRRARQIRDQLAAIQNSTQNSVAELNSLLIDGPFPMAYAMAEGTPHNVHMQLRGEPSQPGEEVPRGLIYALGGRPLPGNITGSGRLELAEWLTQPDHPLTTRVMANRIWQYHFGRGLVKTPNDFGVRGIPPTHPELLDHLATEFVRSGWSIKAMHRLIMLSATYQQASEIDDAGMSAAAVDKADLYTHFARRRLSAEEIRDSILAVSGDLDTDPAAGHPFPSPITWGFSQHGPFSAVYDHNKRSVYLMTQRLKRHPFLALFDGPDTNASTADRLGTTVPTQALYFLNDPFVHSKADSWASRLASEHASESQQIETAYHMALSRSATAEEVQAAMTFLENYRAELSSMGLDNIQHRAMAAFLRTLLGSNEFLHVD